MNKRYKMAKWYLRSLVKLQCELQTKSKASLQWGLEMPRQMQNDHRVQFSRSEIKGCGIETKSRNVWGRETTQLRLLWRWMSSQERWPHADGWLYASLIAYYSLNNGGKTDKFLIKTFLEAPNQIIFAKTMPDCLTHHYWFCFINRLLKATIVDSDIFSNLKCYHYLFFLLP